MFPVSITVTFLFVFYQKSENSSKVLLLWQLQGAQCTCLLALCSVTHISPAIGVRRLLPAGFMSPSTAKAPPAHRQMSE